MTGRIAPLARLSAFLPAPPRAQFLPMSPRTLLALLALLAALLLLAPLRADEPFLKKGDVIALLGGEDMVAAAEYGYLELLLTRALPEAHLRFRSLAWEGDTVFEQRRDLGYPTLEQQLDQIGATVVILQFGQMESLAGKEKLPEFIAAYEKLIARLATGKRRVVLVAPNQVTFPEILPSNRGAYAEAITKIPLQPGGLADISPGRKPGVSDEKAGRPEGAQESPASAGSSAPDRANALSDVEPRVSPGANIRQPAGLKNLETRDGLHLTPLGHLKTAFQHSVLLTTFRAAFAAGAAPRRDEGDMGGLISITESGIIETSEHEKMRQLIIEKNRLWYHYYRPSNWAFLAGDRTNQPSSRDHLDPSKRWFPAEMEQWIPLIDAKEQEIWATAEKLARP